MKTSNRSKITASVFGMAVILVSSFLSVQAKAEGNSVFPRQNVPISQLKPKIPTTTTNGSVSTVVFTCGNQLGNYSPDESIGYKHFCALNLPEGAVITGLSVTTHHLDDVIANMHTKVSVMKSVPSGVEDKAGCALEDAKNLSTACNFNTDSQPPLYVLIDDSNDDSAFVTSYGKKLAQWMPSQVLSVKVDYSITKPIF